MHTTSDDPKKYRSQAEEAEWAGKDPIPRFQRYLLDRGLLSPERVEALEIEVKAEIQRAVDRAEARMKEGPDPMHMFEHTFAELPPTLQEHREELRRELDAESGQAAETVDEARDILKRAFSEITPGERGAAGSPQRTRVATWRD
jgi:hypothetical protein